MSVTYLQIWSRAEIIIGEKFRELVPRRHLVPLIFILCPKYNRNALVIPGLDIVVTLVPSVDKSFDGIPLIADDETSPR
jgi:hypothetical protein